MWGAPGYADSAQRCIAALVERGLPVTWQPMHYYGRQGGLVPVSAAEVHGHPLAALWQRPTDYDTVLFQVIPHPGLPAWMDREAGKHQLLSVAWETDRLPADWPPLLNAFERVLVPSEWNRQVCQASGVRAPVEVVPHLPPQPEALEAAGQRPLAAGPFVFYTIGEWTRRKAFSDLLAAYWQAFSAADPVRLVIKTSRLDLTLATNRRGLRWLWRQAGTTRLALLRQQARQQLRRPGRLAPVELLDQPLPAAAMAALHARGDAYVSLTRGEGWGLGAYDAAARGKPVIMTGWGGQLDFLPAGAAYRVDYRLAPARGGVYEAGFTPEQRWAQADPRHAAQLMRQVVAHPAEARARGQALQRYIGARFNARQIVDRLLQALAGAAAAN